MSMKTRGVHHHCGHYSDGTKSDLVGCLEGLVPSQEDTPNPAVQVGILDGAAIVNMLLPGAAKTFSDYAKHVFSLYIKSQLQHVNRVDVVWDEYFPESLKAEARTKRGKGVCGRVEPSTAIPGNWQQFLRMDENNTAIDTDSEKQILSTHHAEVICSHPREVSGLAPCTHEEADTRILLHVHDAVKEGYKKVSVCTVDTDDVTPAFCALAATPDPVDNSMKSLERFVVLLYDRTSNQDSCNQEHKQLFTQKGRGIDGLPPTQAALIQHTKRAAYQAVYCWAQMMVAAPELPSPGDWGWSRKDTGGWDVCWTTLSEATKACRELLRCGCRKGCRGQCKCVKAALQCTALCHCGGLCAQN